MTDRGGLAATALVLLLWAAGLGAAAQFAKMGLILPELTAAYPGRGVAVGALVSLVSLVGMALGLVAGLLAARIGPRRLLLGALALGAAVSAAQAAMPPFPVMLALRVAEGTSHLGVVVAAPTLISAVAGPRHAPAAMTLWGTFFGVAFALTAWLGLPLVAAHGPGTLFAAHGAAMAALTLVLAATVPVDPPRPSRAPRLTPGGVARRHRETYASPVVAAPALGWAFYTLTFVALLAVLPGTVAPAERTFVSAAMPLASIAVSMTLGVALLRWASAVQVIGLGFGLAVAAAAAIAVAPGEPWPCIAVLGALGLVQGASFAAVPQLAPESGDQALAYGAVAQTGNLGNLLGTPLFLAVGGVAGLRAMLGLAVACWVAGALAHLLMARRRMRKA